MRPVKISLFAGVLLTLIFYLPESGAALEAAQQKDESRLVSSQTSAVNGDYPTSVIYNIHLGLPQGSRIDYLRFLYYDTSTTSSTAWITAYNGAGLVNDLVNVQSEGQAGYGFVVSSYISKTVDNIHYSYVLNWQPNELGNAMQLCGLRVAYQLPTADGFADYFSYKFIAGAALRPRDASPWAYGEAGCIYTPPLKPIFLPFAQK
jgi:hypothetical protein